MNSLSFVAFYTFDGLNSAQLRIATNAPESPLHITVIVARLTEAHVSHFLGNEASEKLEVEDTDNIIILVNQLGDLVAHGVYEVVTALCEQGYLLMPRGGANLLLDQCEKLRDSELDQIEACRIGTRTQTDVASTQEALARLGVQE